MSMGIVIIGRNEGSRLVRCLESIRAMGCPVVYADSNSTDGSVATARTMGAMVVSLDPSRPLNAARGRKAGFDCLLHAHPSLEQVLFIDGDCELDAAFVPAAQAELAARSEVAVVCGRRSERHPEASIYNRVSDLEWNTPVGERNSCGGDALMRVSAYVQAGGFNETVLAGEEPELCTRIRQLGFKVLRIDVAMSWHDMNMHHLSQWWRRGIRSGFGGLDVMRRHGVQDFSRMIRGTWVWVLGWPLLGAALVACAALQLGTAAAAWVAVGVAALLPLQVLRIARMGRQRSLAPMDALSYGALMMVNKWACAWGQIHWLLQAPALKATMRTPSAWQQDLLRYPHRPFLKEQSIWAVLVYRWGYELFEQPQSIKKRVLIQLYWLCYRLAESCTGISIPHNAQIGGGLRIHHFGNIFINPGVRMGTQCTLRQGVTLGTRTDGGPVPVVGNNVDFGAYAQVFGGVRIGNNCKIGAMAVVLKDVPDGCTAVGNPARIVKSKNMAATK